MPMTKRGLLIVFSGPSGVGKGTMLEQYMLGRENVCYSVSATTRTPRPGEEDGKHYHFLTKQQFLDMAENGRMLEYAQYNGNYYGTPRPFVEAQLEQGRDVVLEIEVQGAMQVKSSMPEALLVFVLPPSVAVLRRRLEGRGTEDEETVRERMLAALTELEQATSYDYVIVNDDLDTAVTQLDAVIKAAKCSVDFQKKLIDEVLKNA